MFVVKFAYNQDTKLLININENFILIKFELKMGVKE